MLFFEGPDAADAGTDDHAHTVGVHGVHVQVRVRHGHLCAADGVLGAQIVPPNQSPVEAEPVRVEILQFGSERDPESVRIETSDAIDAAFSVKQRVPVGVGVQSVRREDAEACHHNPSVSVQGYLLSISIVGVGAESWRIRLLSQRDLAAIGAAGYSLRRCFR